MCSEIVQHLVQSFFPVSLIVLNCVYTKLQWARAYCTRTSRKYLQKSTVVAWLANGTVQHLWNMEVQQYGTKPRHKLLNNHSPLNCSQTSKQIFAWNEMYVNDWMNSVTWLVELRYISIILVPMYQIWTAGEWLHQVAPLKVYNSTWGLWLQQTGSITEWFLHTHDLMDMQHILHQKLIIWHDNLLWAIKKWVLILCNNTKVASVIFLSNLHS